MRWEYGEKEWYEFASRACWCGHSPVDHPFDGPCQTCVCTRYEAGQGGPERGDEIARLRRLHEAATPAPWVAVTGKGPKRRTQQVALIGKADMRRQGEKGCLAVLAGIPATKRADDADLIVAMRNALPELLTGRCLATDPDGLQCRLYLGHDGQHGDGLGTVWDRDYPPGQPGGES